MPAMALDSPALSLARQLNEAFIEVADKVSPAVVVIEVTEKAAEKTMTGRGGTCFRRKTARAIIIITSTGSHPETVEGEGSGVVVSQDGYILTNNHVVENADKIRCGSRTDEPSTGKSRAPTRNRTLP